VPCVERFPCIRTASACIGLAAAAETQAADRDPFWKLSQGRTGHASSKPSYGSARGGAECKGRINRRAATMLNAIGFAVAAGSASAPGILPTL